MIWLYLLSSVLHFSCSCSYILLCFFSVRLDDMRVTDMNQTHHFYFPIPKAETTAVASSKSIFSSAFT